jgi:hypothetical protein
MRDGITPCALLFTTFGLALAFAPRGAWLPSSGALISTLAALSIVSPGRGWLDAAFLGCWISVIMMAGTIQLFRKVPSWAALLLSIDAGAWASAVSSLTGSRLQVLAASPCVLIVWPAVWVTRRHGPIPIRVASSWLIAIAVLCGFLQFLPVTPGYLPDHLE